ncbi:MAG TPA: glycosyltransferase family 4 protein [Candidatus Krumholzibacteria bacterium]|nr:glycosyltransferase family 4 protein [Candidatus Krumholzibacteria bacterium]
MTGIAGLRMSMLAPGLARGGMTRAYSLACSLRAAGVEVEIIGALAHGEDVYPEPPQGITVLPVSFSPARRALETRRLVRGEVLYALKPRVTSFGMALSCRKGRRLLLDIDDRETAFHAEFDAVSWRGRARRRVRRARNLDDVAYTRWMEEFTHRASAITANSHVLCQQFRAVHVPSAKDTAVFDPARYDGDVCRRALGLEGLRVIMFPGTPRPHKGVEDAAAALESLGWRDARLVLVGGREVGHAYAQALEAKYGPRVIHLPRFGIDAMPSVVAAAHVVVVPQRDTAVARAQFPMKITDAMAMAKPIIATRVGDIPAALDGAAYLVEPSSPTQIARALEAIFDDPHDAARRGREARIRCERTFSTTAVAEILRGVLEGTQ